MDRRPLLVLLAVLLALVAGWLLLRGENDRDGAEDVSREDGERAEDRLAGHPVTGVPPSLSGTSGAEAPAADPGAVGEVRVRVVGRDARPLPDFPLVAVTPEGEALHVLFTGEQGEATFPPLPYDGSVSVAASRFTAEKRFQLAPGVPVTGPELVLQSRLGLPCEVIVTDVETGSPLTDTAWSLYPREAFVDGGTLPLRSGRRPIAADPGRKIRLALRVAIPEGYVAWSNRRPYAEISRYATALRYVYPLHREADVVIDVLEHDGSPAREPWLPSWTLAGQEAAPLLGGVETEALALNRLRLRGVPYVDGALLRATVGVEAVEDLRIVIVEARLERRTRLVARLPAPEGYVPPGEPFQMPGESMIGIGGSDDDRPPRPPDGHVELEARLRDGGPAADARVSFSYLEEGYALRGFTFDLDEQGRLRDDIPEGTWRVRFYEPGLVQTTATFEVHAGKTTTVRLREGQGGTVRLRVVGPSGRPLPFARFRLDDWMWRDLENGVQRLDPYVDRNGTRTLRHVSPDMDHSVMAWYAGGRSTADVRVGEGETVTVTVEVEPEE